MVAATPINLTRSFRKLPDGARREVTAGRRYQLRGLAPRNADRRLVSIGQLQLPKLRTKR